LQRSYPFSYMTPAKRIEKRSKESRKSTNP
jgi:hypothetical protein